MQRLLTALTVLFVVATSTAEAATYTASWDANTDGCTAGYRVYIGTTTGTYSSSIDVGNVTSTPVTLNAGATYYIAVRAYNAAAQLGDLSTEAVVVVPALPPPPTALITATLGANSLATVTWQTTNATSATLNGVAVALSGTAQYTVTASTTYTLVATGAGGTASSSATVTVPVVDCVMSAWTFQSATPWSTCSGGTQSRTETWVRSILTPPSGGGAACGATSEQRVVSRTCVVSAPTAQIAAVAGTAAGTANVSWQTSYATSATINGLPVALSGTAQYTIATTTSYTIVASGAGGSVSATATVVPRIDCVQSDWSFQSATAWSACTGGTQTRTETWARSIITEPLGGGAACGPSSEQRTASQACSDPTPVAPGAPTNFRSSVSGSRVTLSWNVPVTGGAPLGYRLSVGTSRGGSNIVDDRNMGNVLSVSGDLPRGSYYARVLAYNGVGSGPYATEVSFRVGARSRLTSPLGFAASLQDGVAVLTWQPPACEQEDSPTKYLIEAGSAAGSTDLATIDAGPATSFQAAVPPGTYYVRVRAMNELGAGDASSEIVLRATSSRAPGAPAGVAATVAGAMVTLTWSAPTTGAVPASYTIEAGRGHNLADLGVLRVGNATRFTTTVGPGNYFVRVRAVAADGTAGDASEEIIVRR